MKAFIFDLDGVLVFTDKFHYQAWKTIATNEGIYFDEEINNRLRGVSRMESLEIILERANKAYTPREKENLANQKNEIYRLHLLTMTKNDVSEDTRCTMEELRKRGIKIALGSSSKNARLILEKTELTQYFDAISDGNNITKSKPNPEVFLKAAQFLSLSPSSCAVVEDAKAGIDAAKAGGFTSVGISDAKNYEKTDFGIDKLPDLLALNF